MTTLQIELMNYCNLKCRYCFFQHRLDKINKKTMNVETFKNIVDKTIPVFNINCINFGTVEPFLHPKLFEMADYIKKSYPDIVFSMFTNGMLLNENIINNLLKYDINNITFSLDSYKKDTAKYFRTGLNFNTVLDEIKLCKIKDIIVQVSFLANKININDLLGTISLCSDLDVDKFRINGFMAWTKEDVGLCLYSYKGMNDVKKVYKKAKKLGNRLNIEISKVPKVKLKKLDCNICKTGVFVNVDGNVSPCHVLGYRNHFFLDSNDSIVEPEFFGNCITDNYNEINYNRDEFINVPNWKCKLCAMGYGVIC